MIFLFLSCPFPYYWMCHIAVALLIAVAVWWFLGYRSGLTAGAFFYVGREFTQWESGLPFDLKGLIAPVLSCLLILCLIEIGTYFWGRR